MGARNHYMRRGAWACGRLAVLGLVMFASACSTTQQASIQQMDIKCSFLGSDCDQLMRRGAGASCLTLREPPRLVDPVPEDLD